MNIVYDASALQMVALQQVPGALAVAELAAEAQDNGEIVCAAQHAYFGARSRVKGSKVLMRVLNRWLADNKIPVFRLPDEQMTAAERLICTYGIEGGAAHAALIATLIRGEVATFEPEMYLRIKPEVFPHSRIRDLDDTGFDRPNWA